jgi:signal transduction histidine kinase
MPVMQRIPPEFRDAYREYDREITIRKTRLGCFFGIVLVPLFAFLDYARYPDFFWPFLLMRVLCSVLMAALYPVLSTSFGRRHYQLQGVVLLFLPAATISWMIYYTGHGAVSPYYAGLTLVLMVLAVVLDWTFWQSVASVILVVVLYVLSTIPSAAQSHSPEYINNFFFLLSTGIAIITGAYYHSRVRVSEFVYRCKLDKSTKELAQTNQKLLELDEIKSRFFANISHELRTPLTLLLAPVETLMRQFSRDQKTADLLGTMHSNGMRLLKLINDLLELVRLQSGRMEVKRERVDPHEFIKGLISSAKQMADRKGLSLGCQIDTALGSLVTDRGKLEKIILNLVFNALKFTPQGGCAEVRAQRQEGLLVITVTDTGIGIAEKDLPYIFDRFWQADSSSKRKYQGVGIGLALVKELAEIQGGTVAVQSHEGRGTVFTVNLPYEPAEMLPNLDHQSPEGHTETGAVLSEEWLTSLYRRAELFPGLPSTPVQQPSPGGGTSRDNGHLPSILIADDEPDMLNFLKNQLSASYRIVEAADGQQAVEKAFHFLPDMIILDMMMPHKDGLQACHEIREHTPTRNIPILLLTARADEDTKLASLSAGASDFLTKPFSTTELQVRIKNLIELHGYQRALARQNQRLESTIDQLKETETRLVQSEKLNSLTRWSAEIIHQMNNPLNYANMALESLHGKSRYIAQEQQKDYDDVLADARDGIRRLKEIVSELKMFAHPETQSRDQVEVAECVAVALRFLRFETEGVRVETDIPAEQTVWVNKSLLIHVFMNLLQNSADALKKKAFVGGESPFIQIRGQNENGKVVVSIRDNGTGIAEENRTKVFDPFFTTKDIGQGMGLGLAICYRIVQEFDGRIDVKTETGNFCEFVLTFPAKG